MIPRALYPYILHTASKYVVSNNNNSVSESAVVNFVPWYYCVHLHSTRLTAFKRLGRPGRLLLVSDWSVFRALVYSYL